MIAWSGFGTLDKARTEQKCANWYNQTYFDHSTYKFQDIIENMQSQNDKDDKFKNKCINFLQEIEKQEINRSMSECTQMVETAEIADTTCIQPKSVPSHVIQKSVQGFFSVFFIFYFLFFTVAL